MNASTKPHAYYPALDGFRAVAVLMVFSVHYLGTEIPLLRNWGWMGVDFFFVLSGFLITGILYDSRTRLHRFRDFYARRVLRIFPLYYGVWLALLLLWPVFHWRWNAEWLLWPAHLGNLARFLFFEREHVLHLDALFATTHQSRLPAVFMGHFWSLCVEEQFYLVWPAVVLLARSRRALSGSSLVLLAGMVIEHRLRTHTNISSPSDPVISTFGFSAIALAAGGLILELIRTGSPLAKIASFAPLRRLGLISYGFYVFHDLPHAMYWLLATHLKGNQIHNTAALAFLGTLALSLLSFRYFETPFLALKTRFASQVHRTPTLQAPVTAPASLGT